MKLIFEEPCYTIGVEVGQCCREGRATEEEENGAGICPSLQGYGDNSVGRHLVMSNFGNVAQSLWTATG